MRLYKDIHAHPGSLQGSETDAKVAAEMRAIRFEVDEQVGQDRHGRKSNKNATPTLMVRTGAR